MDIEWKGISGYDNYEISSHQDWSLAETNSQKWIPSSISQ